MRDETPNQKSIPAETMRSFAAECRRYIKLEKDAAMLIADSLIYSYLWVHTFHGIIRLFWYSERILSGATRISNEPEWEVDAGCIGFLPSNASASMAPWGGVDRLVSNNSWSLSAHAGNFTCFILDISNSAVARGVLLHAKATSKLTP